MKYLYLRFIALERFPFDWRNPIGYLIVVTFEYIIYFYVCLIIACILGLEIGAYLFGISATKDIQRILHIIKINYEAQKYGIQASDLMKLFAEFINVHGSVKQLSTVSIFQKFVWVRLYRFIFRSFIMNFRVFSRLVHDFSGIFQPMCMLLVTWCLVGLSVALLVIQVEIVEYITFKIYSIFYNFSIWSSITVASWQWYTFTAEWDYKWPFRTNSSVHCVRTGSKN